MGHRRVEQGADHSAVQDSCISLPFRSRPHRGDDRASTVGSETQSEQSVRAAGHALGVAGRWPDLDRVGRFERIPELYDVGAQWSACKLKTRGNEEMPRKKEISYLSVEFFNASICR